MIIKIMRSWLTGMLVFIPFQHSVFRIMKTWSVELSAIINLLDEITIITAIPFAVREYYNNREVRNPLYLILLLPVLAFMITGFVSGMTNGNSPGITAYGTFDYIKFFLVFFIFAAFFRDIRQFQKIFRILLIVAVSIGIVALIQELWAAGNRYLIEKDTFDSSVYLFRSPPETEAQSRAIWRLGIYRASSLLSHSNLLGLYSLFILAVYLHTIKKINPLILLSLFLGVFLSVSKVAYTGFLLVTGTEIYRGRKWFILLFIPLVVLLFFLAPLSDVEGKYWASGYEKMTYREYAQQKAMEVWKDHPVLGTGPGMFGGPVAFKTRSYLYEDYDFTVIVRVMHSLEQFWPQVLAELGVIGGVACAGLFLSLMCIFFMAWKQTADESIRGLLSGLLVFTVIFFLYTGVGNLNNVSILFPYLAFAGMALGCSHRTEKMPVTFLVSYAAVLFSVSLLFYAANPFQNRCVQGNCANGTGTYAYHSGIRYKGEWKSGKRHGQGTWTHPRGSSYTGEWKNGKRHGQGTSIRADGVTYTGEWKSGKKHGTGTLLHPDGIRYEGEWENSERHGQGTWVHPQGFSYVGEWKNGKRHGQGTWTYPDGKQQTGIWKENIFAGQ